MTINQPMTENVEGEELLSVENNYWAGLAGALERLEKNEDFKSVVLNSYFKDFAINQVSQLAMDYTRQHGTRPEIMELLVAVSNLQDYFMTIKNLGSIAQYDESEDEIEE